MKSVTRLSRLALTGAAIALTAILIAIVAGLGSRLSAWPFTTGFIFLKCGTILALAGLAVSMLALYSTCIRQSRRGTPLALTGLILAAITITPPLLWLQRARTLPVIHDISTDTMNPPQFIALLPLRQYATNTTEYGGTEIATLQHQAYPGIKPAIITQNPRQVFDSVLRIAREMGWRIIVSDPGTGRIEATDTTFWFGFTDDIVIRISDQMDGTRVDIRSLSRTGRSDAGTNARRITRYMKALRQNLGSPPG